MNGLSLYYNYPKICSGFVPMILESFDFIIPNNIEQCKMILNFFNSSIHDIYFSDLIIEGYADYIDNLVTKVFMSDPITIVNKKPHSNFIIKCAESLLPDLLELGMKAENAEKRMPPLLIYADLAIKYNRCVESASFTYYPIEIKYKNENTKIIRGRFQYNDKIVGFRYHFGTGENVLTDWLSNKSKDFSKWYKMVLIDSLLMNKITGSAFDNAPPVVVYFACLSFSVLDEIPDKYLNFKGREFNAINQYINPSVLIGFYGDFYHWAQAKKIAHIFVDIEKTHAHGVDYDSPENIKLIDVLANSRSNFPSKLFACENLYNKLIYFVEYKNLSGLDAGGLFRDSFYHMVNEIMDVNARYFINPPNTLHCENDKLVPSTNLPDNIAFTVGSLLASAIATQNSHKAWNLPRFIWYSFSTNSSISTLVDCDDSEYFKQLSRVVLNTRKGFWKVLPMSVIKNVSGRILEGMACGNKAALDYITFLNYFNRASHDYDVWETFETACAMMTSEELSKLLAFITGNETPKITRAFFLRLCEVFPARYYDEPEIDETKFRLPEAHTCFNQIDIMPYRDADLLKKQLLICISYASTIEDNH
ncbi:hypothetical protein TVAG_050120 [Trichomonas vaginalis G3]|uniref:HECT-type E3 ubiquitin transferase n=1 Tax=Trichomonas vaginalis (strain ATCC PRA-98 / G3) TaxID=412133 RepID=A2EJE0_TRIV3|nr:ubiquitin protein ligase protein [Trichomonas vaginalis G3]EAY07197.1 hypothetical protein TVAG_050120 [Trichomonas vaginalis G3]KAI5533885.1 ubiquitin protein ligase protein [Trichomonas vaginalis G3]|eukprot:XP_001319420.1 hypothetical protein [Trichomonas vaginalis G3]